MFQPAGPSQAAGALVWLHGSYDGTAVPPPPEPEWVGRMAARGLDIWRFDRKRGQDPLLGSGERLLQGLGALRAGGYRRIIAAGHSRGAWIALSALTHPGAADAIVSLSPAAHGTQPERRTQALAEWTALWKAVQGPEVRIVLVQLVDDPWDPDPVQRQAIAQAGARRAGLPLLSIFMPPDPVGHGGAYEAAFDRLFGAEIAAFADPPSRVRSPL